VSAGYLRRCAGKKRYESSDRADRGRNALCQHYRLRKDAVSVYRCDQCLGWHVGRSGNYLITRKRSGKRPNKRLRGRV